MEGVGTGVAVEAVVEAGMTWMGILSTDMVWKRFYGYFINRAREIKKEGNGKGDFWILSRCINIKSKKRE